MGSTAVIHSWERESDYVVAFGEVEVNFDRETVAKRGVTVNLAPTEYELLTYFLLNADKHLTRDMILGSVWSYLPSPNTRTVDAHVLRLRQKLEPDPNSPRHFLTVHRVGYCFRR